MKIENKANEVFKNAVQESLKSKPNQWTGTESAEVIRAIVTSVTDADGNPIALSPGEKDVIQLASRPTHEVQVRVIKRIIETHGGKIDADTEDKIKRVVSPTAFKTELTKAGFIKDTGTSDLKVLLS